MVNSFGISLREKTKFLSLLNLWPQSCCKLLGDDFSSHHFVDEFFIH